MVSSLVDAVLQALDDAVLQALTGWCHYSSSILGFGTFGFQGYPQKATREIVSADKTHTFQESVGTPFVTLLMENISSRFTTHDIVSVLAIFDPRNVTSTNSSQFPTYGKKLIEVLLNHYGNDKFALILNDEETGEDSCHIL